MLLAAKRLLGFLGLGLGVAAAAAPQRFADTLGLNDDSESVRAFGVREIAAGAGLLSTIEPSPWLWMQVGGDLMGAFTLRKAVRRSNPRRGLAIAATAVLALVAAADIALAVHASLRDDDELEPSEA